MRTTLLFSILFAVTFSAYAQQTKTINTEQELRRLSNDWMTAAVNRDEKTLNKIVAPEFKLGGTNIDSSSSSLTRDIWMKNTLENLKIDSFHYIRMNVDLIDDVAIVRSTFYWSFSFRGQPTMKDTGHLIDTWIKRKAGWQVVSRLVVDK